MVSGFLVQAQSNFAKINSQPWKVSAEPKAILCLDRQDVKRIVYYKVYIELNKCINS